MTERLPELQRRIGNLSELLEIIGAMRSMAGIRHQQAHAALPGIGEYVQVVDEALYEAIALTSLPRRTAATQPGPSALIVFCAEHGFVGAFNDHVLDVVAKRKNRREQLLVIGTRGATLAEERGHAVDWFNPMASHVEGVIEVVRTIADEIYRRMGEGVCAGVDLLYAESSEGLKWRPVQTTLLPFDFAGYQTNYRVNSLPLHHLAPDILIERLVDEFVFGELMRAATHSFASENSARLLAMEAARENVDRKLGDLQQHLRRRRQEDTTEEILDIIIGAEAARETVW